MILIGLGANLSGVYETPEECLRVSVSMMANAGVFVTKSSNIWKSAPVPISDQPWYRNAVCAVKTKYNPQELLGIITKIEALMGRERGHINAARVIDVDILGFNNSVINNGNDLQIPHPRMHERAFVLYPLQEIAPNWVHPSMGKSVDKMIYDMPSGQDIKRIDNSKLPCTSVTNIGKVRS